jgi:hypothetical protein
MRMIDGRLVVILVRKLNFVAICFYFFFIPIHSIDTVREQGVHRNQKQEDTSTTETQVKHISRRNRNINIAGIHGSISKTEPRRALEDGKQIIALDINKG